MIIERKSKIDVRAVRGTSPLRQCYIRHLRKSVAADGTANRGYRVDKPHIPMNIARSYDDFNKTVAFGGSNIMLTGELTNSISLCLRGSNRGIDLWCGGWWLDREVRSRCRAGFLCGVGLSRDVGELCYVRLLFDIELEDNFFLRRRSNCP